MNVGIVELNELYVIPSLIFICNIYLKVKLWILLAWNRTSRGKWKTAHWQREILSPSWRQGEHVCRGCMREARVNTGIAESNRSSIWIPFPEPIKVYFVSADNQHALMSVWGINDSVTALAFGLTDARDCRAVEMGAVNVLPLEATPNFQFSALCSW